MIVRKGIYLIFLFFSVVASAQESREGIPVVCHGEDYDAFTVVAQQVDNAAARAVTSAIDVTYVDFPENAKAAFEKAVSIWETYLVSSQIIKINATWKSLESTTLAQTGATKIYRNFPLSPETDVWYPVPLAEAISGRNLNKDEFEINVNVNSGINWSYNLNAAPAAGRFDMVTVILHEIAHGLGINSSMALTADETKGMWGQSNYPYAFDNRVQNGKGEKLVDAGIFGNPSVELKRELTVNNLFFLLSDRIYQGPLPRLNAPDPFRAGGSVSHLDERTYPPGNENSLMTPSVRSAEVNHNPGQLTLLMLNQLGWGIRNLKTSTAIVTANEAYETDIQVYPNPSSTQLHIRVPTAHIGQQIMIVNVVGNVLFESTLTTTEFTVDVSDWQAGSYFLIGESVADKRFVKKFLVVR